MTRAIRLGLGLAAALAALSWGGAPERWFAPAEALVGRPATPLSVAGVARRSTVRAVTPGAGGIGVLPGAGAGQVGVGYSAGPGVNLGGPVNRVGLR